MEANLTNENRQRAAEIGEQLRARGLTIAAAESCTGGLLLSTLTDNAGSSAYVLGGMMTYSNEAKMAFVGVREETLLAQGAVSEAVAAQMARGVRSQFGADFGIGITGIAGPGGGTPEKPVGLVYIALASADGVRVTRSVWEADRVGNKLLSVREALAMLNEAL